MALDRRWTRWPLALVTMVGLLLGVYAPTFALTVGLHLRAGSMIPVVIVISAVLAFGYVLACVRYGSLGLADFGLRWPAIRFVTASIAIAAPVAVVITLFLNTVHEPGPLEGMVLSPLLTWLYFGLGAPLQEELIFRGLLQTVLTRQLGRSTAETAHASVAAMICVAALFALVHLKVGPFTAIAALVLALIAGELRRRSGSLAPAILAHAIFNICGLLLAAN